MAIQKARACDPWPTVFTSFLWLYKYQVCSAVFKFHLPSHHGCCIELHACLSKPCRYHKFAISANNFYTCLTSVCTTSWYATPFFTIELSSKRKFSFHTPFRGRFKGFLYCPWTGWESIELQKSVTGTLLQPGPLIYAAGLWPMAGMLKVSPWILQFTFVDYDQYTVYV